MSNSLTYALQGVQGIDARSNMPIMLGMNILATPEVEESGHAVVEAMTEAGMIRATSIAVLLAALAELGVVVIADDVSARRKLIPMSDTIFDNE